jgi:hypothetical protein
VPFEVHAPHFDHDPDVARLGQESVVVDKSEEVHVGIERPGFVVVPENPLDVKHA